MTETTHRNERLLVAADVLRLPILLLTSRGRVEEATPSAEALLHLRPGESKGKNLCELTFEGERTQEFLRLASRSGSPIPGALLVARDGGTDFIRCLGARMGPREGREAQIAIQLHSESPPGFSAMQDKLEVLSKEIRLRREIEVEYRKLLQREKQARRKAESADRLKDEFLAIVSHELRTPLNAVLSWTQILKSEDANSTIADGLERIERNTIAQAALIDDLLDTSQIVSNRLDLEVREVRVGEVLERVLETIRPRAEKANVRLDFTGDVEARAELDAERIQQVLRNLVENAVKYSQDGGFVECKVEAGERSVRFSVRDEGRGLRDDELSFIFDRFRQVDQHSKREYGGLGLGLAIARQLVELHGGTIKAESAGLGHGSTFSFDLPRHSPIPTIAKGEPSHGDPPNLDFLRGARVLLVEDNDDARDALLHFFKNLEADVVGVASVAAAMAEIKVELPVVILTDIQMAEQDGYDLLEQVREGTYRASIPILALTAHARPEDRRRAEEAGFDAYLAKPVSPDELIKTLCEVCGRES